MATHTTDIYRRRTEASGSKPARMFRDAGSGTGSSPLRARAGVSGTGARVIYYLLDLIEIVLAFRLVFRMIGANAANGFVNFIYNLTEPLVAPFRGIIASTSVSGVLVEWSIVIAMVVYALAAYILARLIYMAENS